MQVGLALSTENEPEDCLCCLSLSLSSAHRKALAAPINVPSIRPHTFAIGMESIKIALEMFDASKSFLHDEQQGFGTDLSDEIRCMSSGIQATCPLNDTRFFKPMDTPCNRHTALCDRGVSLEKSTSSST